MSSNFMISIPQAQNLVKTHIDITSRVVSVPLLKAHNRYLAEDVTSMIHMPPFHQSAMDGYAVYYTDETQTEFKLVDEIQAGSSKIVNLKEGEAVRIFTGAPTPTNANAVIMQEKTSVTNDVLTIDDSLKHFKNIRPAGEQIQLGETALEKGTFLNSAAIGYLATLGFTEVPVYKKPKIAIVVTGNELVSPGQKLAHGQIYESNAIMLQTALLDLDFVTTDIVKVQDDYQSTKSLLETTIQNNDFVLVSGGISVGDYDFVGKALEELNTEQVFYKVKQKPGKPLFFGRNENTFIFALPGNPGSALTCFHIYVKHALLQFFGKTKQEQTSKAVLKTSFIKKGARGEFLKGHLENNEVRILNNQSSAMLNSFAVANCLICIPEDKQVLNENEEVEVILI